MRSKWTFGLKAYQNNTETMRVIRPVIIMSLVHIPSGKSRKVIDRQTYHCQGIKLPCLMCNVPNATSPSTMIAKPFMRTARIMVNQLVLVNAKYEVRTPITHSL